MKYISSIVVFCFLGLILIGCGGRTANPVAAVKAGDEQLSCSALRVEMAHVESQVQGLLPKSKKTGKNVALGTAGLFLIVPFFFMDFSGAEQAEIRAFQERYGALQRTYANKGCSGDNATNTSASETTTGVKDKLNALKTLLDDGVISKEEYDAGRTKILDEL